MHYLTLYDRGGAAVAYLEADGSIYSYAGSPAAYIAGEDVYGYDGRHLGWFADGWVSDRDGACVYFTESATGGPARPRRQLRPLRALRGGRPVRAAREHRPRRPTKTAQWSPLMGLAFFAA